MNLVLEGRTTGPFGRPFRRKDHCNVFERAIQFLEFTVVEDQ